MKSITTAIAMLILVTVPAGVYAGEYNFKPGLWETTSSVKFTGLPAQMAAMMEQAPITEQHCMSEKELFMNSSKECKYTKNRVSAKKLKVSMTCNTEGGVAKGQGEINFNGKNVDGWFEIKGRGPAGPMTTKNRFTSKYLGVCDR